MILREARWFTRGHTAGIAHSRAGISLLSLRLILFRACQWAWTLCQADMFSVDGDLFSFLLDTEIAHLLPSFSAVHTKRSPHPLSPGEQVSLTLSRSHLFFQTLHLVWSGQQTIAPETRIQTHTDEASSDCDPAFRLFLSPSFPFPWHLSKCLLSLGSWWVWCCPDAFSGVSGFTKGQVDVHSASGLFDARRVSAHVSWGSQERFASCRGLDKPQLISMAS